MVNILSLFLTLFFLTPLFATTTSCASHVAGYNVVKESVYPFRLNKVQACFFAFYTKNPHVGGSGNFLDHTLWYGYYKKEDPTHIYEFPKPSDMFWSSVCHLDAVSFYNQNEQQTQNIIVIGSCYEQHEINYRFPLVFIFQKDKYILNEDVYSNLYGFIELTVADIKAYLKDPKKYYPILRNRYKSKLHIKNIYQGSPK